jgi:hypothetical protein
MVNKGANRIIQLKKKISFSRIKTVTLGVLKAYCGENLQEPLFRRSKSKIVFNLKYVG